MATKINKTSNENEKLKLTEVFVKSARFIGLLESSYQEWFTVGASHQEIERLISCVQYDALFQVVLQTTTYVTFWSIGIKSWWNS